jgi:putative ABC transport system permease protein
VEFTERAAAIPGVRAVGAVNILPLTANYDSRGITVVGRPIPDPGENPAPQARTATPGYFDAMGIPLLRGRLLDSRDQLDSPLVMVISQSLAEQLWPGEDPIGQQIAYNSGLSEEALRAACPGLDERYYQCNAPDSPGAREIVGVVGDVKHLDLREAEPVPMFYTPNTQTPSYHAMNFVVRAQGDPTALVSSLRAALADVDPEVPLAQLRTLDEVLTQAVAQPMVRAGLIGMFAVLAVLLAWVGVYGVVGYLVTRRTQEIGIRMALGAPTGRLLRMLASDGLRPVAIGIAVGVPAALALNRLLESVLFGVTHLDPVAYLLACGVLASAGLVATLVPARRALAVNPATALGEA